MKRTIAISCLLLLLSPIAAQDIPRGTDVPHGTGTWDGDTLGNHRAVIRVGAAADAVRVVVPWRRRDADPEKKGVILMDAKTGSRIANILVRSVGRESGEFVFQPASGPGDYFLYFMPYRLTGSRNYPRAVYSGPDDTADEGWAGRVPAAGLPEARVTAIQSVDEFSAFTPMEIIATAEETRGLLAKHPDAPFLLFPEDRTLPIRMTDDLPLRWIRSGAFAEFRGEADRGEFYAFQVGVAASGADLADLGVGFSGLAGPAGRTIPPEAFRCINTSGIDWDGRKIAPSVSVAKGKVQALWCGVQIPNDAAPGAYRGKVTVQAKGTAEKPVDFALTVTGKTVAAAGDDEPARLSRLRWLDSTLATDDEIVAPFTALRVENETVSCLGRTVALSASGFPKQVKSFFSEDVARITGGAGRDLLTAPFDLVVETMTGTNLVWDDTGVKIASKAPGRVAWTAERRGGTVGASVQAAMEMDGFLEFTVRLSATEKTEVKDVYLEVPISAAAARYMMGLGQKGGFRPAEFSWAWDRTKNQDALWLGDVNAGMQISLRAENYSRPLNTNFYLSKPLNLPPSWWNEGKGRVTVTTEGSAAVLKASGGPRTLEPGRDLYFNFTLLLTPFKTIDPKSQWATRFMHAFKPLEEVAKSGANTINVHHATDINPYINYPFLRPAEMKAYIDEAHKRGFRVKIYDTIRELSNRAPELFALRSLGSEIFTPGPGGGYSWLQEHFPGGYIAAWFVPQLKDAAVINSGMSRWHNFYIEGLDWLARNIGIDGLYLDDVAFDRTTMKRVRKVLDRNRPAALIDLHSANQYNPRDGYASSANLYLEHFPYLNRLWFGEYFDYDSPPDYWLVEMSGIPFGLMGEMLQDGGNPWRGMLYGMTNRLPWSGRSPAGIWKIWDDFGMADTRMFGYWVGDSPVKTDDPDVLATAYVRKGGALIALASWDKGPLRTRLEIDWKALGLDPAKARLTAPEIPGIQLPASFRLDEPIPVEPGKGWILVLK